MLNKKLDKHLMFAHVIAIACSAICMAYIFLQPLYVDTAATIHVAQRIVGGERLYRDIALTQTPFILYYYTIPVWISHFFSIDIVPVFLVWYGAIIAAVSALCVYIVSHNPIYRQPEKLYMLAVFIPLLLFVYCCFSTTNHFSEIQFYWGISFGQREHLFFILFLPYILLTLNTLYNINVGRRLRILIGVLGLLGCIIKPHFIIMYIINELYLMVYFKNWRIFFRSESLIIVVGSPIAHTFALLAFPEYFDWFPLYKNIYITQVRSLSWFLADSFSIYFAAFLFTFGILFFLRRVKQSPVILETSYLIVLIVAGYLLFFIQRAGHSYHGLPMFGCMFLLAILVLVHFRKAYSDQNYFIAVIFCLVLFLNFSQFLLAIPEIKQNHRIYENQMSDLRTRFHNKTFMILSTEMNPGYLVAPYVGWQDISHTMSLQIVPYFYMDQSKASEKINKTKSKTTPCALVCTLNCPEGLEFFPTKYNTPENMSKNEKQYFDLAISDVVDKKPDLLLVEMSRPIWLFRYLRFSFIKYYSQDKRFQEAFKQYHEVESPFVEANVPFKDFIIYQKNQ